MKTLPELDRVSASEKDPLLIALWAELQRLRTRIAELEAKGYIPGWLTKVRRALANSWDRFIRSLGKPFAKEGKYGEHASSV